MRRFRKSYFAVACAPPQKTVYLYCILIISVKIQLTGALPRVRGVFMAEKKISLADTIHDEILDMVIRLSSDQEDVVLTEGSLVEKFGVSKAPVREALVKLCSEGVLKSVPRYGYIIVRLNERDARDIAQFRLILELSALKEAFPHIRPEDLKPLRCHLDESKKNRDTDVWTVWEDNEEFHCLLASLAGNRFLVKSLRESMAIQKRVYAQIHWQSRHSMEYIFNPAPHEDIFQALKDGNLNKTLQLLHDDILHGKASSTEPIGF